jgi:hypothetical protein
MSRVYRELMSSRWCGVTTEGKSRVVVGVCKAKCLDASSFSRAAAGKVSFAVMN